MARSLQPTGFCVQDVAIPWFNHSFSSFRGNQGRLSIL